MREPAEREKQKTISTDNQRQNNCDKPWFSCEISHYGTGWISNLSGFLLVLKGLGTRL